MGQFEDCFDEMKEQENNLKGATWRLVIHYNYFKANYIRRDGGDYQNYL